MANRMVKVEKPLLKELSTKVRRKICTCIYHIDHEKTTYQLGSFVLFLLCFSERKTAHPCLLLHFSQEMSSWIQRFCFQNEQG